MAVTVKVDIPNISGISKRLFTPDVKKYAHTRLHAYCDPYVPMDTGALSQTVNITEDYVHYKVPYAHRVHEGNGMHFSTDKHPLATSHWEKAAMTAKGQQLADDIAAYIKRK